MVLNRAELADLQRGVCLAACQLFSRAVFALVCLATRHCMQSLVPMKSELLRNTELMKDFKGFLR